VLYYIHMYWESVHTHTHMNMQREYDCLRGLWGGGRGKENDDSD
jgi:hypothetical protein